MKFGAHVSISENIHKAIDRGRSLGCETIQIFHANPRQWQGTSYSRRELEIFRKKRKESEIESVFCHTIYLLNLSSPEQYVYKKSIHSLVDSLRFAQNVKSQGVVTHLGSHLGRGVKFGIQNIISAINYALESVKGGVPILLENSAGGGTKIGGNLEEIAQIIKGIRHKSRIFVCLDTAHTFQYGYDIKNLDSFLLEFDKTIGLDKLCLLHLNDSKTPFASHHDQHENIGGGFLGIRFFKELVNDKKLQHLPAILETPNFKNIEADRGNLDKIRKLVK